MLAILLLVLACKSPPDPDARLRAGDLEGAAVAWEALHGSPLDVAHPAAVSLAARAPRDPSITAALLVDTLEAVRLLEQAPVKRTEELDLTFDRFTDLGAALDALAEGPAMVAVGRSETFADRDPYTTDAPLPWKGGRLVGFALTPSIPPAGPFEALGAALDANPPAKLVTVGVSDVSGILYLNVERRDGTWWAISASNGRAGARLVLAAASVRDYGGATLRERQGGGFVRR
ncbi:MAG: hypothetical protein Q8P18_34055 [Pseudomonadota bacterium]|nr:hypothetical protein [Pseudomonadota bacterium]